jgi:hypothetical protein
MSKYALASAMDGQFVTMLRMKQLPGVLKKL